MPKHLSNPDRIFQSFERQRIMVVGDVMLDRYIIGRATRISPEAPVPVLEFESEEDRLGGAANVALNLLSLGATPILCSVVGKDVEAQKLLQELEKAGISDQGILQSSSRVTTVKSRIVAGKQQMLRLDKETTVDLSEEITTRFLEVTLRILDTSDITALIFQDYNKGVLTVEVIETLIVAAKNRGIPVAVDPKLRNFWVYQGVDLFKPNLKEVRDALRSAITPQEAALKQATNTFREKMGCKIALVTLSEQGVFLDDGQLAQIFPTKQRTVADVCGAGDAVISIAALALAIGLPVDEIALLANLAGGQVVEKTGVVPVDKEQLHQELMQILLEAT